MVASDRAYDISSLSQYPSKKAWRAKRAALITICHKVVSEATTLLFSAL